MEEVGDVALTVHSYRLSQDIRVYTPSYSSITLAGKLMASMISTGASSTFIFLNCSPCIFIVIPCLLVIMIAVCRFGM